MLRVSVVGSSGSGKSTLARSLAAELNALHLELDSIFHQPGWTPLPDDELRERVEAFMSAERWVIDGNYSAVRPLIWAQADTVVWLDLPRWLVMRRLLWRTLSRMISRRELWNGNRESARNLLHRNDENILWWAWTHHVVYRDRYAEASIDPANAYLHFVRIRSRAEIDALLNSASR